MSINRRLWAGLIPLSLFASALAGAAITPRSFFSDSLYWLSVLWFGVVGAILLGNTNTVSRIPRYTSIGLSFFVAVLALGSRTYPEATTILYGLVGIFAGFGIRVFSFLYVETKWRYCEACGRNYWHMKRNGVWVCQRATHTYVRT